MDISLEIAQAAARLIVDEGLDYGSAKRLAVKQLGLPPRSPMPGNDEVEVQVREHIAIFHADTQPGELAALRALALRWMERLAEFRPHLSGAVWHGTATRMSDIHLQLFCDDSKSAEIALIDQQIHYQPATVTGMHGRPVEALTVVVRSRELASEVAVHLMVYDHDDLRGALKPDAQGRVPRGDLQAVRNLVSAAQAQGGTA
ncbi:hypothetical protein CCO03_15765 [Comamonas serinivorans]|uniref:Nucleotidyltransferase n=1 Tax=Comamonas serinivorans TaxID=1082851 RepID=A0A1Y0EQQ5_9BURK|nr:hypothetical protein [Comamonas serinivorans]ARU05933.1 hypothetical protein CCO03_15765 [Comamonas serinivorans]